MDLDVLIVKCVSRLEEDTVNGALVKVKLVPSGPLCTMEGSLTFYVHSKEDLDAYKVGREFRLTPEMLPLPEVP